MATIRQEFTITGAVQGVGFRPFVYRLAQELGLTGWVKNTAAGVIIQVEGEPFGVQTFAQRLPREKPVISLIQSLQQRAIAPQGDTQFQILASGGGAKTALVLPELATCDQCLGDIGDRHNRRYRYPFTNCTNCGPRYSIIEALPYDRPHTAMKGFPMCDQCQREYDDPSDRRFHAQPNACPQCGPQLALWNQRGEVLAEKHRALEATAQTLAQGKIVAVKGLGGFHLMVAAHHGAAIATLRQRKQRPAKPLAIMVKNLAQAQTLCQISETEAALLRSPQAPIVLLAQRSGKAIAPNVAPQNPHLGVMLPYTPLHHLLLQAVDFPLVATSGNFSQEPICIDENEALERLQTIADLWLVHNRPIVRPVDDSVVRVVAGKPQILRRARGYAPMPIPCDFPPDLKPSHPELLAVGGHFKNTIAIASRGQVFLSQHIGDLGNPQAQQAFHHTLGSLAQLYDFQAEVVSCDRHPDYHSTQFAHSLGLPVSGIQHHYAHIMAVIAEHHLQNHRVLGVAWDGTGYGEDGTIWGGEFFLMGPQTPNQPIGRLLPFPLVGGNRAAKEPRRSALGLLNTLFPDSPQYRHYLGQLPSLQQAFTAAELKILSQCLQRKIQTFTTSSMGRFFDGVAALLGLTMINEFEGQGAMNLEFHARHSGPVEPYPWTLKSGKIPETSPSVFDFYVDWRSLILQVINDHLNQVSLEIIATKFHHTLGDIILKIAQKYGCDRVVFGGGCFQNRYLLEHLITIFPPQGITPHWPQIVPPNDGAIAFGQIVATLEKLSKMKGRSA